MSKGLIGKKLGMTQIFDENGDLVPVTVVQAGPCTVVALRTTQIHGYSAVQLAFGKKSRAKARKPLLGHVAAAGLRDTPPAVLREVRFDHDPEYKIGDKLGADLFGKGDCVDVTGRSKGRGFQGVVKRWNFGGGRASHGGGWTRRPGSIGMCVSPARVYKGRKMPGRMGGVRRTVQNLTIVDVRPEENLILVKGAVPGPNGGLLLIRSACKK
ncbi:MAG: 50S ribosomal protein L3 [Kiritimatiellaeota bacterium]|nr:50S ribosomal protein L3 [Kiritimatiellota bacterium]